MAEEAKIVSETQNIDAIIAALVPRMGEQLGAKIAEVVDAKLSTLGKVERKSGMFGESGGEPRALTTADRAKLYLRGAITHSDPGDEIVRKALSEGTDSAGGYLVPTEYRAELIKRLPELSELFPYVRKVPVSENAGEYPKLSTDVSMTWGRSENAAMTETDAVFTNLTWTIRNCAGICYMSRELVSDSNPGIVDVITGLFTEAIAAERDKVIAIGNSSNSQPEGIYSASGLSSVAVSGSITYAKLVQLKYELKRKYQRNARWVLNSTNLQRITALVDTYGQPIIRDALVVGESPIILGKPFSVQDDLPSTHILYGDLTQYFWFDRESMVIETTTQGGDTFSKHQFGIKIIERLDGKLSLAEAFVVGTAVTG